MIYNLNESIMNEVKSIDIGNGATAYQSNGSYYIKKGDTRKEISAQQYQKFLNKSLNKSSDDTSSSENGGYTPKEIKPSKKALSQYSKVEDTVNKYTDFSDSEEFSAYGAKEVVAKVNDYDSLIKDLSDKGYPSDTDDNGITTYKVGSNCALKVRKSGGYIRKFKDGPSITVDFNPGS